MKMPCSITDGSQYDDWDDNPDRIPVDRFGEDEDRLFWADEAMRDFFSSSLITTIESIARTPAEILEPSRVLNRDNWERGSFRKRQAD